MRRSWRFIVGWLSATVAAVTVSWLGVQVGVAPAITDEAPVAIDVNRRYTEVRFGVADAVPPPSTSPVPKPKPSRTSARPSKKPSAPTRPAPSRSVTASPSPSPSPSAVAVVDRRPRYRVNADAGSVIIAYSSSRVDAVDADPLPGFVVSVLRRSNTMIVVRIAGSTHASVITAYWNGGPAAQIVEEYG